MMSKFKMETILDLAQHRWPRSVVNPEVKPRWDDMRPREAQCILEALT